MRDFAKPVGGGGTNLLAGAVGALKLGKRLFDRGVARLQPVILSIADIRRIVLMIGLVGRGNGQRQRFQLGARFVFAQVRDIGALHRRCTVLLVLDHRTK